VEVASENMANAIRLLCADRGLDYRRFDLEAFGGAGPLHAAELARRVGLGRLVVPPNPGLTSAFGAQAADLRVDRRLTRLLRSDLAAPAVLREAAGRLAQEAVEELRHEGASGEPTLVVSASCRYLGQNYEQEVPVPLDIEGDLVELMVERFGEQHRQAYGYRLDGTVVELVHLSATAVEHRPSPTRRPLEAGQTPDPVDARPVYLKGCGRLETAIYRRLDLPATSTIRGPAIIEELDSTTLVLPDQLARVHASGCLIITEISGAELAAPRAEREAARA
ncbi:MAG: hydantoinase/oxoprolinase family protein, partial [Gaiellales bacterium]